MSDIECPYCDEFQDIDHDDGYGYEEDEIYNQECSDCGKRFTYTTGILFVYETEKADCLNDGKHQWDVTSTFPKKRSVMCCSTCDERRDPTSEEREKYRLDEGEE